jgi:N6-adenosine-specific RNA methylase IME4
MSKTAIRISDDVDFDAWLEKITSYSQVTASAAWWIGDLLVYGEERFAEQVGQVINDLGLSQSTVANYVWCARAVSPERRREDLSWEHHRAVAKLDGADQEKWLNRAAKEKMSAATLKTAVKLKLHQQADREAQDDDAGDAAESNRFRVVFADIAAGAEMDALERVKVPAEPNSVLFMLVPSDRLQDGMVLMETWGFAFEQSMVWDYGRPDGKFWARVQHRVVLIGTRGNIQSPPAERLAPSRIVDRMPKNGGAPDELYSVIEAMFPARSKSKAAWLDMFGTDERDGWATPLVGAEA